jgi:hypothetical protein
MVKMDIAVLLALGAAFFIAIGNVIVMVVATVALARAAAAGATRQPV